MSESHPPTDSSTVEEVSIRGGGGFRGFLKKHVFLSIFWRIFFDKRFAVLLLADLKISFLFFLLLTRTNNSVRNEICCPWFGSLKKKLLSDFSKMAPLVFLPLRIFTKNDLSFFVFFSGRDRKRARLGDTRRCCVH